MAQGNPGPPGGGTNNNNRRAGRGAPPTTTSFPIRHPNQSPLDYRGPRLNHGTPPAQPHEDTARPR